MRRPRFTIRSLVLVVLVSGVGIAALRAATDAWDSGIFAVTILTMLTATLLFVHRTGRQRAFWLGFALFGWTYLVASLVPPIESRLPTTKGLAYLDAKAPGRERNLGVWLSLSGIRTQINGVNSLAFSPQGDALTVSSPGGIRIWNSRTGALLGGPNGTTENFLRIGHSLLALILALLGGRVSLRCFDSGRSTEPSSGDSPG